MSPQSTEAVLEHLDWMETYDYASNDINHPLHANVLLHEISTLSASLNHQISNVDSLQAVEVKRQIRTLYSNIVKLEMWRQVSYNDRSKIRLFHNKRKQQGR